MAGSYQGVRVPFFIIGSLTLALSRNFEVVPDLQEHKGQLRHTCTGVL